MLQSLSRTVLIQIMLLYSLVCSFLLRPVSQHYLSINRSNKDTLACNAGQTRDCRSLSSCSGSCWQRSACTASVQQQCSIDCCEGAGQRCAGCFAQPVQANSSHLSCHASCCQLPASSFLRTFSPGSCQQTSSSPCRATLSCASVSDSCNLGLPVNTKWRRKDLMSPTARHNKAKSAPSMS